MELKEYMRELWLMEKQYGQEEELYPFINMMLRESKHTKQLSIRTVANGRTNGKSKANKLLFGYAGFPDIAILDENFLADKEDNISKIYGCVEAKAWSKELLDIEAENSEIRFEIDNLLFVSQAGRAKYRYYVALEQMNEESKVWIENGKERLPGEISYKGLLSNAVIIDGKIKEISYGKNVQEKIDINPAEWKLQNTGNVKVPKPINEYMVDKMKIWIEKDYPNIIIGDRDCGNLIINDVKQLIGELLWYRKVLYTNGIIWKYLEITECRSKKNRNIRNIVDVRKELKECVGKGSKEIWYKKIANSDLTIKISCKTIGDLTKAFEKKDEKKLNEDDEKEWSELKSNLASIRWKD